MDSQNLLSCGLISPKAFWFLLRLDSTSGVFIVLNSSKVTFPAEEEEATFHPFTAKYYYNANFSKRNLVAIESKTKITIIMSDLKFHYDLNLHG